jgi:hypothetical protein
VRNSLLEHERAHKSEDANTALLIQGYIEGHPGKSFTVGSLAKQLDASEAAIQRMLPSCQHYEKRSGTIFVSTAPKIEETKEGVEEANQLKAMGWIGVEILLDFFQLQKRRKKTKRLRATR